MVAKWVDSIVKYKILKKEKKNKKGKLASIYLNQRNFETCSYPILRLLN